MENEHKFIWKGERSHKKLTLMCFILPLILIAIIGCVIYSLFDCIMSFAMIKGIMTYVFMIELCVVAVIMICCAFFFFEGIYEQYRADTDGVHIRKGIVFSREIFKPWTDVSTCEVKVDLIDRMCDPLATGTIILPCNGNGDRICLRDVEDVELVYHIFLDFQRHNYRNANEDV